METVRKAELLVESSMVGRDASHDPSHAFRVRNLALSLAKEEGLDDPSSPHFSPDSLLVVELAALLHDIGDYKYSNDQKEDTTAVEKFLDEEGLVGPIKVKILDTINKMGFKDEVSRLVCSIPSLEFGVVQDADRLDAIGAIGSSFSKIIFIDGTRLDAIGAIGIARCFTYGGSNNNMLYDPRIPPRTELSKEKYVSKDEKTTSINHFHEKLLKLKDLMKTKAGQRRAEKRHKFLENFLSEFHEEWDGRA